MKNKKGISLIEIVISVGLFALLSVVAIGTLVMTQNLSRRVDNFRMIQEETISAVEYIQREINSATGVRLIVDDTQTQSSCSAPKLIIQSIDPNTGLLTNKIFEKDTNGNLAMSITDDQGIPIWAATPLNSDVAELST